MEFLKLAATHGLDAAALIAVIFLLWRKLENVEKRLERTQTKKDKIYDTYIGKLIESLELLQKMLRKKK